MAPRTLHIFRYGRSDLHGLVADKSGAGLPPQDVPGMWRYFWTVDYAEGDVGPFDVGQAFADIDLQGYHLFEAYPSIKIVDSQITWTPEDAAKTKTEPLALNAHAAKELLKPVDLLIIELKNALEYYNAGETDTQLKAENNELINKAKRTSDLLGEVVLKIAAREMGFK